MADSDDTFEDIIFYKLPVGFIGATWEGFTFDFTETGGTNIDSNLAQVDISWFDGDDNAGPVWSSAGGSPKITITSADGWAGTFANITPNPFGEGTWRGVLKTTRADAVVKMFATFEQESRDPKDP